MILRFLRNKVFIALGLFFSNHLCAQECLDKEYFFSNEYVAYVVKLGCDSSFSIIKKTSPTNLSCEGKWEVKNKKLIFHVDTTHNQSISEDLPNRVNHWQYELCPNEQKMKRKKIILYDKGQKITLIKK